MSQKSNVIHKQIMQNSNKIVEVIVKSKPKPKIIHRKNDPYVRNCLVRKEIGKIESKKNSEKNTKTAGLNEQTRKARTEKNPPQNHILPQDSTWAEFLHSRSSNYSSACTSSSLSSSSQSLDDGARNGLQILNVNTKKIRQKTKPCQSRSIDTKNYVTAKEENRQELRRDASTQLSHKYRIREHKEHANVSIQGELNGNQIPYVAEDLNNPRPLPERRTQSADEEASTYEQTHSPFGESALHLLRCLRERLRSRGDSESSDILKEIEAYFEGQGGQVGNVDKPRLKLNTAAGSQSTPNTVFGTPYPNQNLIQDGSCGCHLKIRDLKRQINEKEEAIQDLTSLAAQVVAHHEQLAKQDWISSSAAAQQIAKEKDGADGETADKNTRIVLKELTSERDALLNKLRSHSDIIMSLELKLNAANEEIKIMKKQSPSQIEDSSSTNPKPLLQPANLINKESKPESEVDSAFDERTGSRSTSKRSSPYDNIPYEQPSILHVRKQNMSQPRTHDLEAILPALNRDLRHRKWNQNPELELYPLKNDSGEDAMISMETLSISCISDSSISPKKDHSHPKETKSGDESSISVQQSHSDMIITNSLIRPSIDPANSESIIVDPSRYLESTPVHPEATSEVSHSEFSHCSYEELRPIVRLVPEETFR